jgi:phage regulator Rha-like protein
MLLYKIIYAKLKNKTEVARMFGKHHASVVNGIEKLNLYVLQVASLRELCAEVGDRLKIKMFAAA